MARPLTDDPDFNRDIMMMGKLTGPKYLSPEIIISTAKADMQKALENTRRARWNETAAPGQKAGKLHTAFMAKHLKDAVTVQDVLTEAIMHNVEGAVSGIKTKNKGRVMIYEGVSALKEALELAKERGL